MPLHSTLRSVTLTSLKTWLAVAMLVALKPALAQENPPQPAAGTAPAAANAEAVLDVQMNLLSFDAIRGEAEARTTIIPKGPMANKDGLPARNLRVVDTESVVGNEVDLKQNRQIPGVITKYEVVEGDASAYPFDKYKLVIGMYVTPVNAEGAAEDELPMDFELNANLAGFTVEEKSTSDDESYAETEIYIKRSTSVVAFSVIVMIIMWVLALIVLSMAVSILKSGKMPETGALGFMAALLFAFPAIRNAQPNVPPVGTFSDFAAFFWAELIVVLALLIVGYCWLSRYRK